MKNEKVCPKCTSSEIIRITGVIRAYGAGNNILKGSIFTGDNVMVPVTRYMCGNCGFSEEWIDEKRDIESIKKWWDRKNRKSKIDNLETDENNFQETPPWDKKNLI